MIWILVAIVIFGLMFLAPGIRLVVDPEFRGRYLRRKRQENERLRGVLPQIADWIRISDIWGLRASEPDDLRSVGWRLTFIGGVAISACVVGLVAMGKS